MQRAACCAKEGRATCLICYCPGKSAIIAPLIHAARQEPDVSCACGEIRLGGLGSCGLGIVIETAALHFAQEFQPVRQTSELCQSARNIRPIIARSFSGRSCTCRITSIMPAGDQERWNFLVAWNLHASTSHQ